MRSGFSESGAPRGRLNKTEIVQLVKKYDPPKTTFATYARRESRGVEPKPLYLHALEMALDALERRVGKSR